MTGPVGAALIETGTRRGTLRGAAATADESGRRATGLTAGAAVARVGACYCAKAALAAAP